MKIETNLRNTISSNSLNDRHQAKGPLRKAILNPLVCSVLASVGIFGGISALFIGLVCVAVHALVSGDQTFDRVGTVLLITAIPAILVGSIFLDEIDRKK